MTPIVQAIADRLTDTDRAALARLVKRDGTVRRTPPSWRTDPAAWAAWQGIRTAMGWHGESATFTLMMVDEATRDVWDRVSDAAIAVRREMRRA